MIDFERFHSLRAFDEAPGTLQKPRGSRWRTMRAKGALVAPLRVHCAPGLKQRSLKVSYVWVVS